MDVKLQSWDIAVVVVYFLLVLATGFYSMFKVDRGSVSGYFLAGRFMFWLPVGASIFASNIGSEHFIGLAGSGAASGIGVGAFELNALVILQLAGWIFLPVFIASKVSTLPEYMHKRFGRNRIRTYLAVLSLILYVLTKISVNLYAGAIFIQQALRWNLYVSVILLLFMTALCTVTGGLTAVMYTDTLQFFVMIIGAGIVAVKAFMQVGGYYELQEKYMAAVPSKLLNGTDCGIPKKESFQLLGSWDDPDMPWLGFLLGQTPASIWYWCTDQMIVQRLLAAKSISHAQGGTLFAGYMKILPLFFIVMPGMISRVLFTDEVACVDPEECYKYCQSYISCTNIAYPRLVLELMPDGLRGLLMAVMLAALMSDLTSIFNSASTLFTMDIWNQFRKSPSVRELMIVGRSFVIVMVVISIAWIPVIQAMQGGQLFIYIQVISAYLAPPIAAVYLLAVLNKRINEKGAFWALMSGFVVGIVRMSLDFAFPDPGCGQIDTRPALVKKVHYMYFAIILFWTTIIMAFIISFSTEKPAAYQIIRTTFWTRHDRTEREDELEKFEMKKSKPLKEAEAKPLKPDTEFQNESSNERTYRIVDGMEVQIKTPVSPLKQCWSFFCGLESNQKEKDDEAGENLHLHLESDSLLKQTPCEKITLWIFLALVLTSAASLFLYFSVGFLFH